MNEMQILSKPEFGRIGALTAEDGTPWFNAADVCKAMGYSRTNDAVRLNVDEQDTCKQRTLTAGGKQMVNFVNESGLYSLILSSKLPNAKAFKRWITSEVLPSLRKHGAYLTPQALKKSLTDPEFVKGLVKELEEERKQEERVNGTCRKNAQNLWRIYPKPLRVTGKR